MKQFNAPFRFDIVGSFLRPEQLKRARADFAAGSISREQLTAAEDEAVRDLIQKQKQAGLSVITDGELRRSWWHLDFMWGLNGVEKREAAPLPFHGELTRGETAALTGKISGEGHPFVEHFRFVKQFEDENTLARQTIPAPAQFYVQLTLPENIGNTRRYYPDDAELIEDIGRAYRTVIGELYEAGCRNVQLDDCTWGLYVDRNMWKAFGLDEESIRVVSEKQVALNNLAIEGKPEDLVVNTHVCRGNFHSTYASEGAYDPIAPYLFAGEHVDAFYLEYDTERAGGFEPLRYVPDGKKVVLGLITSKQPELEDPKKIIARIWDAAKYVPLERLYLSPQCGFASTEEGNKLTEEQQWAKLALVREVAERVWG